MRPRTIPPVHFVAAAIVALLGPRAFPSLSFAGMAIVWLGRAVVATGLYLVIRTFLLMKKRGTTFQFGPTTRLIESGVFSRSRNPMYAGMTAILLGAGLAERNFASLIAPIYFFLLMDRVFVPFEERKLEQEIGAAYAAYRRRVRRWI